MKAERLFLSLRATLERMHARGKGMQLGDAHYEMGYRLGPLTWLQPDISITHAGQPANDYYEGAPALAVEMVSDSNTPRKIARKVSAFLAHGAVEVCVIYPDRGEVTVNRQGFEAATWSGRFKTGLLPGVEIDLDAILAE